ncbi:hypothetical protein PILCRDRAFT_814316 [Piloderma croceum F 1598]|uniref:DUF6533 domain-containing protein n=1 Tax=Piloderma croceum (strain F 1598) TaxID=765440 RepID=A0A0C3GCP2_PILCF|nr:hypothetical protein PILCRDRAFT_814316 [Piloderma croceum F 1598]
MANNNSTIPPDAILNPYTPLAFLPPDVADQFQVICYVNVAILAAVTWDWLMAIPEEYLIIRKIGFSRPNIVYFLSRFGTFGYCLTTTIFRTVSIDDCKVLKYVKGSLLVIGVPATSLLFLFRVKAVYNNSKIITAFFGLLWLAITGLNTLILLGKSPDHIPYTKRCMGGLALPEYTTAPIIVTVVNDTLVLFAISYRMLSSAMIRSTWRARTKSFFTGDGLMHLSWVLLQSGQVYYFVTIGFAITITAFVLSPSFPVVLKPILGSAYIALSNVMACRVYRVILAFLTDLDSPEDSLLTTNPIMSSIVPPTISPTTSNNENLSDYSPKLAINASVETDEGVDATGG